MLEHAHLSDVIVRKLIRKKQVLLGGNRKLKIYGTLSCTSGMRMKKENRVFFISEEEAISFGYRPCGHCKRRAYVHWLDSTLLLVNQFLPSSGKNLP